ncbi:MAG TPA: hypothetical protein VF443_14290 [Nitrospira sp.]
MRSLISTGLGPSITLVRYALSDADRLLGRRAERMVSSKTLMNAGVTGDEGLA